MKLFDSVTGCQVWFSHADVHAKHTYAFYTSTFTRTLQHPSTLALVSSAAVIRVVTQRFSPCTKINITNNGYEPNLKMGCLHDLLTCNNTSHSRPQLTHWNIQNKSNSHHYSLTLLCLEVSLYNSRRSMADVVPSYLL